MAPLYLFCLIVGGGLLLFSLLGHDGEAHAEGDLHFEGDAGIDLHSDHDSSLGEGWGIAREFFSIRALRYLLAGFGATGLLLESLTDASAAMAALLAALTGVAAAVMAGGVYGWLKRSESGLVPSTADHLVGLPAHVVLPVLEHHRGKVRVVSAGREIELLARLYGAEDGNCPRGSTVVIVDIQGDTALVTSAPSLPSEFS